MRCSLAAATLISTVLATCKPSNVTSTAVASDASKAVQSLYGQCGGQNWSGPTACTSGSTCTQWNPYYHQCLAGQTTMVSSIVAPTAAVISSFATSLSHVAIASSTQLASSSSSPSTSEAVSSAVSSLESSIEAVAISSPVAAASRSISSSSHTSQSATAPESSLAAASTAAAAASSTVYKASFTQYGSTDTWGSGTCNTNTAACGFYSNPGYNAAISENFFGVGPGAGAGPGCSQCWALTPSTDSSGNKLTGASSIVVKINNLCPAQGNPLCSQSGTTGTNQYGANVNFDLCIDDGANTALFGSSSVGLAVGTATQVDCSQWSGTDIKKRMSI